MQSGVNPTLDPREMHGVVDEATRRAKLKIGKINVLVAGLAGVGKSTLINAVFGKNIATTGIGFSQTQRTEAHEVGDSPLRIYDTRGFEVAHAQETVGAVKRCVEQLRSSTDPDDQIHIAWTCILEQSHRIEPVHKSLLALLHSLQVPSIVVVTQTLGEEEMQSKVRELAVPNDAVIPVLAEPKTIAGHVCAQSGLSELIETSIGLLPRAKRTAFIAAQKARWDLKERAVLDAINASSVAAGATAIVPIAGGHSLIVLTLQVELVAQINAILGVSMSETSRKELTRGILGIMLAKMGGQALFGMTLAEAMRLIPGLGWFGAAMIGGPIAGTATKLFGHLYFNSVAKYLHRDEPLPSPEILKQQMEQIFESQKAYYQELAKS